MSIRFKLAFENRAPDLSIVSESSQETNLTECSDLLDSAEQALEQISLLKDILTTTGDKLTVAEESFFVMHLNKLRFDLGVENYELSAESFKSSKVLALESLSKIASAVKSAILALLKRVKEAIKHILESGVIRKATVKAKVTNIESQLNTMDKQSQHAAAKIHVQRMHVLAFGMKGAYPKTCQDVRKDLFKSKSAIHNRAAKQESLMLLLSKMGDHDDHSENEYKSIESLEPIEMYGMNVSGESEQLTIDRFTADDCKAVTKIITDQQDDLIYFAKHSNNRVKMIEMMLNSSLSGEKANHEILSANYRTVLNNELQLTRAIVTHQTVHDVVLSIAMASTKEVQEPTE